MRKLPSLSTAPVHVTVERRATHHNRAVSLRKRHHHPREEPERRDSLRVDTCSLRHGRWSRCSPPHTASPPPSPGAAARCRPRSPLAWARSRTPTPRTRARPAPRSLRSVGLPALLPAHAGTARLQQPVLVELVVQAAAADAEQARGQRAVVARLVERGGDGVLSASRRLASSVPAPAPPSAPARALAARPRRRRRTTGGWRASSRIDVRRGQARRRRTAPPAAR